MQKSKNKVNAKKFTYEILISKGKGILTKNAEIMLIKLATNAIRKHKYYLEEDKEDALQTSYLNMFNKWISFNPDKTENAFAYFTEIHKRSCTESINNFYNKKGISKLEQKSIKSISINSINNGQGMYNI